MAGTAVEKIACTKPCGSSDGMQVYLNEDGTNSAHCFVCGYYESNPYGEQGRSSKLNMNSMGSSSGTSTTDNDRISAIHISPVADLSDRKIMATVAEYFGIKQDAGKLKHYYPYFKGLTFTGYKERVKVSKDFYSVGNTKGVDMFGQQQAQATADRRLIITEGELDAAAAFQMLWLKQQGTQYAAQLPAVVSLAHGAQAAVEDLAKQEDFLLKFKEIVLCFDNDKAGQEAVNEVMRVLPIERVRVAKFSEKDACEMLLKGKEKEFCTEVLFNAKPWRPLGIMSVDDAYDEAVSMPSAGADWPWPTLTKLTYGFKKGRLYGIGAGVGIGKSTFWHACIHNAIQLGYKPGLLMLEETPGNTLKNIATFSAHKRFNRPDGSFDEAELRSAIDQYRDTLYLCNHRHMALQDASGVDEILMIIRHMTLVEGCDFIVIDPLTALTAHVATTEANEMLNSFMAKLAGMCESLNFVGCYGSHLNPPRTGPSHEEGGRVMESQFTGSRAMIKWSHYIIGLERNKQAEDMHERNTTVIRLLKDRDYGNTGTLRAYYDQDTGTFNELSSGQDRDYSAFAPTIGDRPI